jgi:hypothetical protein
MATEYKKVRQWIHSNDPYDGIEKVLKPLGVHAFNDGHVGEGIKDLVKTFKPKMIIEVGSWMGYSADKFASSLTELGETDSGVVCVDTWLGANEFWATGNETDGWWNQDMSLGKDFFRQNHYQKLDLKCGYPTVYYNFLSNMHHLGWKDKVCPFPQTSHIAARWFKNNKVKADMIYIDGSHEYEDVILDLENYFDVLDENAIMFGDDFWITPVRKAVEEFVDKKNLKLHRSSVSHAIWYVQKG